MTVIDGAPLGSMNADPTGDELRMLSERRVLLSHDVAVHRAMGDLENNDPYHRALESLQTIDRRIADLHDMQAVSAPTPQAEDGTARIGSAVTVQFGDDGADVDTFVLVDSGVLSDSDASTCSSTSPLGSALLGCRAGDARTYTLPTGASTTVHVVEVS